MERTKPRGCVRPATTRRRHDEASHTGPSDSSADLNQAPRLVVEPTHVDLGVVRRGGTYDFSYVVTNAGQVNLLIRRIGSITAQHLQQFRRAFIVVKEYVSFRLLHQSQDIYAPLHSDLSSLDDNLMRVSENKSIRWNGPH